VISSNNLLVRAKLPRGEAIRLLSVAAGVSRARILAGVDLDADAVGRYVDMVERRLAGTPLQHLEGSVPFGALDLKVDRRALIPRPETEYLWSLLTDLVEPPDLILDIGTGTGALALALQATYPGSRVIGVELSPDAVALARENVATTGVAIDVLEGDLFDAIEDDDLRGRFGLIVSNPLYVSEAEWAELPVDVRDHDPPIALVAGPHGTEIIARIVAGSIDWLGPGGSLAVEIGEAHGQTVHDMAVEAGYAGVRVVQDLAGRDRYLFAERADD